MAHRSITVNADCPICGLLATSTAVGDSYDIACGSRCGTYRISGTALQLLLNDPLGPEQAANASAWIGENSTILVDSVIIERLRRMLGPPVSEKAERLLRHIAKSNSLPGASVDVELVDPKLWRVAWARNAAELSYLLDRYLVAETGHLEIIPQHVSGTLRRLVVTPSGWAYLETLRHPKLDSTIGFIAIWFRPSMTPVRQAIEAAVAGAGYEPKVMLTHEHANRIDDEIAALIQQSRFVVADFTGSRGGVYFEAGYAHGLGVPLICTCRRSVLEGGHLHFDINHFPFITWEAGNCEAMTQAVRRRIEHVVGKGPIASA